MLTFTARWEADTRFTLERLEALNVKELLSNFIKSLRKPLKHLQRFRKLPVIYRENYGNFLQFLCYLRNCVMPVGITHLKRWAKVKFSLRWLYSVPAIDLELILGLSEYVSSQADRGAEHC